MKIKPSHAGIAVRRTASRRSRREFIAGLGAIIAGWPLAVRAQQPAMPVVGFLNSALPDPDAARVRAFRQGLSESGFVVGQNVAIEYRWAENQNDRLPALAADLVRNQVAAIVAFGIPPVKAAMAATKTIPIVFEGGFDPVGVGAVASLNRPGGNVTGVTILGVELEPKRLELLHEIVPAATTLALLVNPTNPNSEIISKELQAAARTLGLGLHVLQASSERDFDAVFATLAQARAGGLVLGTDGLTFGRTEQLAALSVRHAVPAIFQSREFAAAGGLMSYGGSTSEGYRLAGGYIGRTLKGEKPADLPVQQATKVELIINLKTAKALGLTVPLALLGRADQVIE
jgi:ABC-type uncharacterized transport system substrate-binding protein